MTTLLAATLLVRVLSLHSDDGMLRCAAFSAAAGFPTVTENAVARGQSPIREGTGTVTLSLPGAGEYAIACLHDENNDGALQTNLLGIPREGTAVSKDIRHKLSAPKFEEARFHYDGTDGMQIVVHAKY